MQTRLSDDAPLIQGDRVQLQQVLLNLLLNAIEALSSVSIGSRHLVIASAKKDLKSVLVSVYELGERISVE